MLMLATWMMTTCDVQGENFDFAGNVGTIMRSGMDLGAVSMQQRLLLARFMVERKAVGKY